MFVVQKPDPISPLLLGSASVLALVLAGITALTERREPEHREPDASLSAVALALGVALMVGGTEVGSWMLALGAGFVLVGLVGLVREERRSGAR
jgi:hypothetical protein